MLDVAINLSVYGLEVLNQNTKNTKKMVLVMEAKRQITEECIFLYDLK